MGMPPLRTRQTGLRRPAHKARRPDENDVPSAEQNQQVEREPSQGGSPRRAIPSCAAGKEQHIQQIGGRVSTDEQAEQHADAAIQLVVARECALIIEPAAIGNSQQDQGPHRLDVVPAPTLTHHRHSILPVLSPAVAFPVIEDR
jgi:hypothetical protein